MNKQRCDAVLGAIAGDIIGSCYEFKGCRGDGIRMFDTGCRVTDDTVLTLAVTDWLQDEGSSVANKLLVYGRENGHIGYGPSFCKWLMSDNPQPYDSCGNGSAMRVSAVGCVADSAEEALELAKESALPTHNHPEGIKGAQAVALAIFLAREGRTKEEIRAEVEKMSGYDLGRTFAELYDEPYKFHVLCQDTVPEALICFFESTDYFDCIRKAIEINMDTDTSACIVGSVAAAYYGIPEVVETQVRKHLPESMYDMVKKINNYGKTENQ